MKFVVLLIPVAFIYSEFWNAQAHPGTGRWCYGQSCPQNTTYCLRRVNTTDNGSSFVFQVDCLDSNFTSIATYNVTRPNPWDNPIFQVNLTGFTISYVRPTPFY